jgi:hypothetical protein
MERFSRCLIMQLLFSLLFMATSNCQIEDFRRLVPSAQVITIGKVLSLKGQWNQNHTRIETIVNLRPTEVLKGNLPEATLRFAVLGGTADNIRNFISDSPQFQEGETVLLLLHRNPDGTYGLTGYGDGKIGIRDESAEFQSRNVQIQEVRRLVQTLRDQRRR